MQPPGAVHGITFRWFRLSVFARLCGKSAPRREAQPWRTQNYRSEGDAQRHLELALAGLTQALADFPQAAWRSTHQIRTDVGVVGALELRMVEEVVGLHTEVRFHAFRNRKDFVQGEIDRVVSGTVE